MRTVLVTAPARMAVRLGRQEARAMGADQVGSEHLLLGILRSGDQRAVKVLEEMGVTLDDARAAAQPTLIDGRSHAEPPGKDGISSYARSVLEQSLREAVARGEGYIAVEHLLLALLREDVGGAARTLHELGIDADAVRERVAGMPRSAPRG
jgi:ATP-dependent Clp protease ATP-binding subunit ClpC